MIGVAHTHMQAVLLWLMHVVNCKIKYFSFFCWVMLMHDEKLSDNGECKISELTTEPLKTAWLQMELQRSGYIL